MNKTAVLLLTYSNRFEELGKFSLGAPESFCAKQLMFESMSDAAESKNGGAQEGISGCFR